MLKIFGIISDIVLPLITKKVGKAIEKYNSVTVEHDNKISATNIFQNAGNLVLLYVAINDIKTNGTNWMNIVLAGIGILPILFSYIKFQNQK